MAQRIEDLTAITGANVVAANDNILLYDADGTPRKDKKITVEELFKVNQQAAIVSLTAAVGTGDDALVAVSGSGDDTTINNNFQDLADKIEEILVAIRAYDVIST